MMANKILKIGNPACVTFDYETAGAVLHFKDPGNISFWEIWGEKLKAINHCQLYLSGGIDSQFSAHVLKTLGVKFTSFICDMRWGNITVNAHDVMSAIRYCEIHNLKYQLFVLDLEEFFISEEYLSIGLKYKTTSPQIAAHLKMIEMSATDYIVLGGDPPLIRYNPVTGETVITPVNKLYIAGLLCPYYNVGIEKNLPVIKDFFKVDCYSNFLAVKHNLNVISEYQTYYGDLTHYNSDSFTYKQHYYNLLGADIISPLYKATGFETVRKMLAQETGVYDQFDKLYRVPLKNLIYSQPWGEKFLAKTGADRQIGNLTDILMQAKQAITENNYKPCNMFKIDF